jgi:hypothetical protein
MADREQINVGCRLASGLTLHVMKRIPNGDPAFKDMGTLTLAGTRPARPLPPGVEGRQEAFTMVDREAFEAWWEENKDGALVTGGAVFLPDDNSEVVQTEEARKVDAAREALAQREAGLAENEGEIAAARRAQWDREQAEREARWRQDIATRDQEAKERQEQERLAAKTDAERQAKEADEREAADRQEAERVERENMLPAEGQDPEGKDGDNDQGGDRPTNVGGTEAS